MYIYIYTHFYLLIIYIPILFNLMGNVIIVNFMRSTHMLSCIDRIKLMNVLSIAP